MRGDMVSELRLAALYANQVARAIVWMDDRLSIYFIFLMPCDLPTIPLRSTGRSRLTYWAPLLYIVFKGLFHETSVGCKRLLCLLGSGTSLSSVISNHHNFHLTSVHVSLIPYCCLFCVPSNDMLNVSIGTFS